MKYETLLEGHGTPFTLVRCPHGLSLHKISTEMADKRWKAKDVEKNYSSLKAVDFEKSDKELMFVIKSHRPFREYELDHIKKTLIIDDDGSYFCLVIADSYEVERFPKVLMPFI